MRNYMDRFISKSIDSNNIPKELGNIIISTANDLYNKDKEHLNKKIYTKFYKIVAGLCASIILTTSIVFAKDITNYIKTLFNLNEHGMGEQQIESAISENYIQYDSSKYIKSNGIEYKLEYTLLNDINMIFSMDFITDFNIDEFNNLAISGLQIKDENGNQIFIDSEDEQIWTKNIATSVVYNKIEKNKNGFKTSVVLVSPSFPNINTIYISFDKITLYTVINGNLETKEIEGNYNLKLNIDNKFNNRNLTNYTFNLISNEINLNLEQVILTNTGLGITFNNSDYGSIGYKFELFDNMNNKLYSNTNAIDCIGNSNKYFTWIDTNNAIKNLDSFLLKITNLEEQVSSFIINRK